MEDNRMFVLSVFGVCVISLAVFGTPAGADATSQEFSRTPFKIGVHAEPPRPRVIVDPEEPDGGFLRLAFNRVDNHNSLSFQRTDDFAACEVAVDFDFRITPGNGRADGLGFALLATDTYGVEGVVDLPPPLGIAEEPTFTSSLGVGFDVFKSDPFGIPELLDDVNNNHVSIHFDGRTVAQFEAGSVDLASGDWIHATITVAASLGMVSVTLTPNGGTATDIVTALAVQGLVPTESRAWFGARTGGETADFDLDNVQVSFTPCPSNLTGSSS